MPYIKFVNETDKKSYDTLADVERLAHYACSPLKTMEDHSHYGHAIGEFTGCYPFLGTDDEQHDPYEIASLIALNCKTYHKTEHDLMKHRIISFDKNDYILPYDAAHLGELLIRNYGKDYISAYGVHLDTGNIHIHLIINTISWRNGNRFSVPYEMRWLWNTVNGWFQAHERTVDTEVGKKDYYQKYLWNE